MDVRTARHALKYLENAETIAFDRKIGGMEALGEATAEVKRPCKAVGVAFHVLFQSFGIFSNARDRLQKVIDSDVGRR